MIVWSVVLPIVGTVVLLVLLGVGIARSRGLREVLLGIRGKGKVSLLNLFSVEGAGLVLILAIFIGGGIVYPLARATDAERLEGLTKDVERLQAENAELRDGWQVVGTVEVPGTAQIELSRRPIGVDVSPASIAPGKPSGSRVTFTIRIPSKLGPGNKIVPDVQWIYVEYPGYERLQVNISPDDFKGRVFRFSDKLLRQPREPASTKETAPETAEKWETQ